MNRRMLYSKRLAFAHFPRQHRIRLPDFSSSFNPSPLYYCVLLLCKPQTRHSPVIVGDHYELAETVALQYSGEDQGGLLAKAEYEVAQLPMSGYEKSQDTNVNDYDTRRPSQAYSFFTEHNARRISQDPLYLQYALPGSADLQLQQPSTAYDRHMDHMNYGASPIYQPRAASEAAPSGYNNFQSRKTTQATSYYPRRGSKGAQVCIELDSGSDLLSPIPLVATLMFATRPVPARLNRLEAQEHDVCYKYMVSAPAPAFSETGSSNLEIQLSLQLQGQSRLGAEVVDVGEWTYEEEKHLEHRSSPPELTRKRKVTEEPSDTPRSVKRVTPSEQRTTQPQEYGSYPYPPASLAYGLNTMQRKYTAYGRSQLQQSLQTGPSTSGSQGLNGGASTSQSMMRPPMGQASLWSSSHGGGYQSGRNPQSNVAPSFQVTSVSSPSLANPTLVRTTTLGLQPTPGTTLAGSSSNGSFNSYTLYPRQAVLEIHGNLDAMQSNWTPEERAVKRRIVRFWREQNGNTVNAYFKPVRGDEQPLPHEVNEHRINCIYWEERQEYYVTSVDTIFLLESLVGTCFGMDEKNRIRRNLEGYKPCTTSKAKDDSKNFFKLIMGLPDPKPRVIAKDLKVFKWPILEQALKKVFSKFSAVPPAASGSLERQPNSNFGGTQSEAGVGRYSALSSRSTSGSTASSSYAQTLKSNTLSPPIASQGLPNYSQASFAPFPAPSLSHSYTVPTLGSQYMPNDPTNSPYPTQVSIPSLSPAYTASTIGHRRSSDAPMEDTLESTDYYSRHHRPSTSFASPYAPQGSSGATATLGLPGRASWDLSAYYNTDAASSGSIGDAQYRRSSGVNADESEVMRFKEE